MNYQEPIARSTRGFASHPENINRKGQPRKGTSWKVLTESALSQIPENSKGKSIKEMIINRLVHESYNNGDMNAIDKLIRLTDGYAPIMQQTINNDKDDEKSEEELMAEYELLKLQNK